MSDYDYTNASFYVVLKPDINGDYVYGVKAKALKQGKPALLRGEIAVKLNLRFLKSALIESIPQIDVNVATFAVGVPESAVAEDLYPEAADA